MSAMRGRQGRELRRAKEVAAGVVPQLNARRRAAKERAAEAAAAASSEETAVATESAKNPEKISDAKITKKSGNKPSQKRTAGFASEHAPRVAPPAKPAELATAEDAATGGLLVTAQEAEERLDQFLAARLEGVSRARVQLLISQDKVTLKAADGLTISPAKVRASYKLSAGDRIWITGQVQLPPLRAVAEDIPLEIIFEDADLAVVNKPAGMMVHAGAGHEAEDERGKGTMVNALLHHLTNLSHPEDELRPGVVHRLDRQTSGLLVVAKNDVAHQKLSEAFAQRETTKQYLALVHGRMKTDKGSINTPISRDVNRRTRMTTRRSDGRAALTHWKVKERLSTPWGEFSLLEVKIETGRTHQIRAHLSSIGHPVVGDTLYGAATEIKQVPAARQKATQRVTGRALQLKRNFLHAARLGLRHPRSGEWIEWEAPLPDELEAFLRQLREVE